METTKKRGGGATAEEPFVLWWHETTSIHNAPKHLSATRTQSRYGMKFRLQLVTVNDSGQEQVLDMAQLEREGVTMETLGLSAGGR